MDELEKKKNKEAGELLQKILKNASSGASKPEEVKKKEINQTVM